MQLRVGAALGVAWAISVPAVSAAVSATASLFAITDATQGSCGMRGFDTSSNNFIYTASVSAKDISVSDGCGRCVKVTKDGGASVVAYVMDVCAGCASGQLRLSSKALSSLGVDLTANNVPLSYKFTPCPSSMLSGNVKACLMDGADKWYIPLQFYNSQKVITKATIVGVEAAPMTDAFYFQGKPKDGNALGESWFQHVDVKLTAKDGEERSGTLVFQGKTGCVESNFQFSQASTAEADDVSNGGNSSKKGSVMIFAIVGAVAGLAVVIGSIFWFRRRRGMRPTEAPGDLENGYLSPSNKKGKSAAESLFPTEPTFPNASSGSGSGKFDGSQTIPTVAGSDLASPYGDYKESSTPMAPEDVPEYALAPKVTAQPKFTFSKPAAVAEPSTSPRGTYRYEGPMLPAPVLPPAMAGRNGMSDSESDGRGSFDIDDMRTTEAKRPYTQHQAPYDDADAAYVNTAVTSPQSYVRATTLVRPSTRPNRDSTRFGTQLSSGSAAAAAPAQSPNMSPQGYDDRDRDSYNSDNAQYAANNGGYRRDSLGILGYPYAKKPSSRGSGTITGTNHW